MHIRMGQKIKKSKRTYKWHLHEPVFVLGSAWVNIGPG